MQRRLFRVIGPDERPEAPPLRSLLEAFGRSLHALDYTEATRAQYQRTMERIVRWMGETATVEDFTEDALLDRRDELGAAGRSASTIINELAVASAFAAFLRERRLISNNPAEAIRRPSKPGPNPRPLLPHQVQALLEAIQEPTDLSRAESWRWRRNRRIVYLMLFAGLRRGEVLALRWSDVLWDQQILALHHGTKGGRARRVALHPDLRTELLTTPEYERPAHFAVAGLPTGEPLSRGGIEHVFDRWLRSQLEIDARLGCNPGDPLDRLHAHRLRATFATHFAWSGGSIATLQSMLGHRDMNTTNYYVLSDDEQKRTEIARLSFDRSTE